MGEIAKRRPNVGEVVLAAVDKAASSRWDAAQERAARTTGSTNERVAELTRAFTRELATVGAASGGAAAVPGAGTITAVATTAADLSWFTLRSADLILSIAAVHGHDEASLQERRLWILSVLAFGDSASKGVTVLAREAGIGLGKKMTNKVPAEALRVINRLIGRTVFTKYGTKRGVVAIGRALPFGVGAVIGGGSNWALVKGIGRQADKLFSDISASGAKTVIDFIEVEAVEEGEAPSE